MRGEEEVGRKQFYGMYEVSRMQAGCALEVSRDFLGRRWEEPRRRA